MAGGDVFSPLPNGQALAAPRGTAPAEVATPGSPWDAAFTLQKRQRIDHTGTDCQDLMLFLLRSTALQLGRPQRRSGGGDTGDTAARYFLQ